jgi:6-phosphogluconolactonase
MTTAHLLILLGAALAFTAPVPAGQFYVYFGTYTTGSSRGIYVSRVDAATGKLSPPELAAESESPSYLAVSPDQHCLYAANEVDHFKDQVTDHGGAVSAFSLDAGSGKLTFLNRLCSSGSDPCYVSVDASGKVLFTANYSSGSVKSFPLAASGALGAGGDCVSRSGHGPNASRQGSAHAHFIRPDPSHRFALSCDLGTDEVIVYPLDLGAAGLQPAKARAFGVPAGSGPRHLAFSPDGKFAHVINELACTITTFSWDSSVGELKLIESVSALPPGVVVAPSFTAAEILVSGNFVYATIRGHDSVSVLAANPSTGRLEFLQNISSGGKVPRGLGIDPTRHWLLVGNQASNRVVEFSISPDTGRLSPTGEEFTLDAPVDVKFVSHP